MDTKHALMVVTLLLTGCAASGGSVFTASRDVAYDQYPQDKLDKISIGVIDHPLSMSVSTITRISPSDWVPRYSVVVRKTSEKILVCYSIVHRPGMPVGLPPAALRISFVIDGVMPNDRRVVSLSSTCGK